MRAIAAPAPARGAGIDVTIWYPAAEGGTPVTLGESVFFEGTEAMRDAPAAPGPHPVVLLSHGAGLAGRAEAMAWIAAPLAAAGYVVVAPTHPGNTGPDRSAAETIRLWQRPGDLSAALDALGRDPALAEVSDTGDAAVLGLSMGGGTALALAGARYDAGRLAAYCDDPARNPSLCGWLRASGVDLRTMDMTGASGDLRDARVRAVVALDPAPADVFDPASLADVSVPVRIVALGDPAAQPPTLQAGPLADGIPDAELIVVEGADHAGMFPPCKPGAAEIARAEGIEDPICPDGTADGTPDGAARPRADIHAELLSLTLAALEEAFGPE